MLLVASGFGQEHYLTISKDGRSLTEANRLVKTTTHKNGQIDMVVQSSFSAIGGNDHEAINLTKTSIQLVNDSSSSMSFDGDKQSHYIEVEQGVIFMEQNMRFGMILDRLAVLKKNWAIKYASYEGVFFIF